MIHKYSGDIGTFEYDDKLWAIISDSLAYIGPTNVPIDLPKGATKTCFMFYGIEFEEGAYLRDFDMLGVTDSTSMFESCKFCKGFTLGEKFNTVTIEFMDNMFKDSVMREGFTLGDKFYTKDCIDLSGFLCNVKLPIGFTLGANFDTTMVEDFSNMFQKTVIPVGFTLGDEFYTTNACAMISMFEEAVLPEGFTLGEHFDTTKVKSMRRMFKGCKMPIGFNLGNNFSTKDTEDLSKFLEDVRMPEGFSFGNKFIVDDCKEANDMLYNAVWPDGTPCDCGEDHEDYLVQVYKFINYIDSSIVEMSQERARDFLRELKNSRAIEHDYITAIDLIIRHRDPINGACPNCLTILGEEDNFCRICGQKVK